MNVTKEKIYFSDEEEITEIPKRKISERQKIHLEKARQKRKEKSILKKIEKTKPVNTKMDYLKYGIYTFTRRVIILGGALIIGYSFYYIYNKKTYKINNEKIINESLPQNEPIINEPIHDKPVEQPKNENPPQTIHEKSILDKLEPI
jgi:hypothetical protein